MPDLPLKPTTVTICIPSMDEWKAVTAQCLANMVGFTVANSSKIPGGINLGLANRRSSMVTGNRNDLVTEVLKHNTDWFLWIDSDMGFPADTLLRLLSHNLPLVGATYNKRVAPYETCGRFKQPPPGQELKLEGLVEAEFLPSGMMMVHADVYRKLPYPHYYETYWPEMSDPFECWMAGEQDRAFTEMDSSVYASLKGNHLLQTWLHKEFAARKTVCGEGRTMSEDYNFCRKVQAAGYKIWCDLDLTYQMAHVGEQVVSSARAPDQTKIEVPKVPEFVPAAAPQLEAAE